MPRLPAPPKCPKVVKSILEHGETREDPYHWLQEKENPAVKDYVEAENGYYRKVMGRLTDLKENYFTKLKSRMEPEAYEVPYRMGPYLYSTRIPERKEYAEYSRRPCEADAGATEIVLDLNEIAKGHEYVDLGAFSISDDHTLLAYSLDTDGGEEYTIHFHSLDASVSSPKETISLTEGNVIFSADGRTLHYLKLNDQHRPFQVWSHALGTDPARDILRYEEEDDRFFLSLGESSDERWIFIDADSAESTETRFADRAKPTDDFRIFSARVSAQEYAVDAQGERFLVLANHEEVNFVLYEVPVGGETAARAEWKALFRGDAKNDLRDLCVFKDHFALLYGAEGVPTVRVFSGKETGTSRILNFPEIVRDVSFLNNADFLAENLRLSYSSPVSVPETVEYRLRDGMKTVLHQRKAPNFNPGDYAVERVEVKAADGTMIPVSLLFREQDRGKALPTLLYGYGSYGMVTPTGFSIFRATLVDAGFLYAIAHVRGSGDLGQRWYREGKFLKKKNTFTDFRDVARGLVAAKRSEEGEITIHGGSAGGLLVAATLNLDRESFRGVIAEVPFVDVLSTMFNENLPLTPTEWDEWGDPRKLEYFKAIQAYSPYDRVEKREFPYILVNGGWNDSRVTYWEPAKWVAKLRDLRTDDRLTILDIEMGAGHFGVTGRFAALEKPAELLAFLHAIHFERGRFEN
jgi:oligopeptidase B